VEYTIERNMENEIIEEKKKGTTSLKIKGGDNPTSPIGLSRSMLHVLNEHGFVELWSIGDKAENVATAAYRLADEEVKKRHSGIVLLMSQAVDQTYIGKEKAYRVKTRVFPVKTKYVV
jgi:stage V sporulation protein SpoVS